MYENKNKHASWIALLMMLNSPTIISLLFLPASPNYVYMNHIINAPMHFIQLVKKPNDIC